MGWLTAFASEIAITASNGALWVSILQAVVILGACLVIGIWTSRWSGLLDHDAPAGDTLSVGLGSGLVVVVASWAAIGSMGRSSFTPIAVGVVIGIAMAAWTARGPAAVPPDGDAIGQPPSVGRLPRREVVLGFVACCAFVAGVALLYGATIAPSPRDGVQPLEFMDEAYYSILGADLARSGVETIYSPAGFPSLEGLPPQTWYHWGELWLASSVITLFDAEPLNARHFVVLPILLLAAATLTGTLVRRVARTRPREGYIFGVVACAFLAPLPLIPGTYFASWAVGMTFGITMYGLAAVAVPLAIYAILVVPSRPPGWPLAIVTGATVASVLPAHLVIALLGCLGIAIAWALDIVRSWRASGRPRLIAPAWRRVIIATAVVTTATVVWGLLTGHGIGTSGLSNAVSPFNEVWRQSVASNVLGGGAFFAIGVAIVLGWRDGPQERTVLRNLGLASVGLLGAGAVAWGARLGDFTMFHVFFGGIAVFGTPVAAMAVWSVIGRATAAGRRSLAVAVALLCLAQVEFGIATTISRLQAFGPHDYPPIATDLLDAIEDLPAGAKVAYTCNPLEEIGFFWDPRLIGISAHTGHRMVPMCFQAELLSSLNGGAPSPLTAAPQFEAAPQRHLYPTGTARPSETEILAFMREHGIGYIYADTAHPNTLVARAVTVVQVGEAQLLRVP